MEHTETPAEARPEPGPAPQGGLAAPKPPAAPTAPARRRGAPFRDLRELLDMIKFEHTVFALPFALLGAMAAAQGFPGWDKVLWILGAMVGARTAAMTFNRLADADVDAQNPRTAARALPAGRVGRAGALALLGLAVTLFGFSAGMLGPLPWKLAPLALLIILGYSFCKRFTSWSHAVLGLSLAGAPLGAWIAIAGRLDPPAWSLALGVLAWTAGFDIIYALQDEAFDRDRGLHSLPARLGRARALWISRTFHLAALACWADFNLRQEALLFPWLGWGAIALILVREQWIVREGDLSRVDEAFFTLNSLVGLIFFASHLLQVILFARMA
ncbi:MAG: UbiA family prenyltransferase [Acidobacteria bacterium]|nr:UbiA family prenyltransferase [Acidobacteriota bacterium]